MNFCHYMESYKRGSVLSSIDVANSTLKDFHVFEDPKTSLEHSYEGIWVFFGKIEKLEILSLWMIQNTWVKGKNVDMNFRKNQQIRCTLRFFCVFFRSMLGHFMFFLFFRKQNIWSFFSINHIYKKKIDFLHRKDI